MRFLAIVSVLALASASPPKLAPRCSPLRDPAFYNGYVPPVACWQAQDTGCRAYIQPGTDLYIDPKLRLAIVSGVKSYCFDTIKEEQTRELDGRRTYGWRERHGKLTDIGNGILIISEMSDATIKAYQALRYPAEGECSNCVDWHPIGFRPPVCSVSKSRGYLIIDRHSIECKWLVIYDNAETASMIVPYGPRARPRTELSSLRATGRLLSTQQHRGLRSPLGTHRPELSSCSSS